MKPTLTEYQLTEDQLAQLAALTDVEPDTSDSPEIPTAAWATAQRNPFFRARKEPVSLRLDMDVMHWLRMKGPGYQTTINSILRREMDAETSK